LITKTSLAKAKAGGSGAGGVTSGDNWASVMKIENNQYALLNSIIAGYQ